MPVGVRGSSTSVSETSGGGARWRRQSVGLLCLLVMGTALGVGRTVFAATAGKAYVSALLVPSTLPADDQGVPDLYLELLGPNGAAATRSVPTTIALASSAPSVATVPATATIAAGASLAQVVVTPSDTAGTATIMVKASGLAASNVTLTTAPIASQTTGGSIQLSIDPALSFRGSVGPSWVTAELVTAHGAPEVHQQPVTLHLVSSAPQVLGVPATLTVPAGSYFATAATRIGVPGTVTLTALADGYNPGIATSAVRTVGKGPARLQAQLQPALLLPGTVPRLVLQALDSAGNPVPFPCEDLVLSSNAPGVVNLPHSNTPACVQDADAVVIVADAAADVGGVALTAAASGLEPVTVKAQVDTAASPGRLEASVAPLALDYGAPTEGWLVLQLESANGVPGVAGGPLRVALHGGDGAVPQVVIIPAGGDVVAVPIAGLHPGEAPQVSAVAAGWMAGTIALVGARSTIPSNAVGVQPGVGLIIRGRRIPLDWIVFGQVVAVLIIGAMVLWFPWGRRRR